MRLSKYLEITGKSVRDMARDFGIGRSTLYRILKGDIPNGQTARKIVRATKAQVTLDELVM